MGDCGDSLRQLLVVILDINPHQLLFARQQGSFSQVLNSVMTLLSQHLMLHPTNQVKDSQIDILSCKNPLEMTPRSIITIFLQVALVCSHSSGCTSLYPDDKQGNDSVLRQQDGQYEVFYHMETVIKVKK